MAKAQEKAPRKPRVDQEMQAEVVEEITHLVVTKALELVEPLNAACMHFVAKEEKHRKNMLEDQQDRNEQYLEDLKRVEERDGEVNSSGEETRTVWA